tara:strand:+ start:16135 stop:16602 length:468 start_codon:yes stop_codon:yes gene_type:complete
MAIEGDNTAQLSTFSMIKEVLKLNSTLNTKFTDAKYYEFEPNMKSLSFGSLPFIVINVPSTETDLLVVTNSTTIKDYTIVLELLISFDARSKFTEYSNAIIKQLEDLTSTTTFEASGFYNTEIDLVDTNVNEIIQEKPVIRGTFELKFDVNINRD